MICRSLFTTECIYIWEKCSPEVMLQCWAYAFVSFAYVICCNISFVNYDNIECSITLRWEIHSFIHKVIELVENYENRVIWDIYYSVRIHYYAWYYCIRIKFIGCKYRTKFGSI